MTVEVTQQQLEDAINALNESRVSADRLAEAISMAIGEVNIPGVSGRGWLEALPDEDAPENAWVGQIGIKLDTDGTDERISEPTDMHLLPDGNVIVTQYSAAPIIVDLDGNIQSVVNIPHQSPATANTGIAYSQGSALTPDGKTLAIASYYRHCVRVYDLTDINNPVLLYTVGIPGSAGHVATDKLYYPRQVLWLPNGNLLVSSHYGRGETDDGTSSTRGHISEYDGTTGQFIATRLEINGANGGQPESGGVYRPWGIHYHDGHLYVAIFYRNKVARFQVTDNGHYPFDRLYSENDLVDSPTGVIVTQDNAVMHVNWDNGNLYVRSTTDELLFSANLSDFDCDSGGYTIREVVPGRFWLANRRGQKRIVEFSLNNKIKYIPKSPPPGYEFDTALLPEGFDPVTFDLTVDHKTALQGMKPLALPLRFQGVE